MKKTLLLLVITMVLSVGFAFSADVNYVGTIEPFDDKNDGGDSTITMQTGTRDGMTTYRFFGNVTTKFIYGFAGWEFVPDAATLANLKKAKTISFKCLGDGNRYTIEFRISSVSDFGYHEYHFNTKAGEVQTVTIRMPMFMQAAWADKKGMNQNNAICLGWKTHENLRPGSYDITIWDVKIGL
jgi:hypothetical protein